MQLEEALARVVGAEHVLADPDRRAGYERDWTGRFGGPARLVVRPRSVSEVGGVIEVLAGTGIPVIAQGGNTGLVGGGVPRGTAGRSSEREPPAILSLARLCAISEKESDPSAVTAGAGATLESLQAHAGRTGMQIGLDLAARSRATLGGLLATNAGGTQAVRYGTMRDQVLRLEAWLMSGERISWESGGQMEGHGYDLGGLLVGSEGTLGIITGATVRTVVPPRERATALVHLPDLPSIVSLVGELMASAVVLDAVEWMSGSGVAMVCEKIGIGLPELDGDRLDPGAGEYLLVESAGEPGTFRALGLALERVLTAGAAVGVASTTEARRRMWIYRDHLSEAIQRVGVPHKLDVRVPLGALAEFVDMAEDAVQAIASHAFLQVFGHIGVGDLHVNVVSREPSDMVVDDAVLGAAVACGGRVAGEHGVGVAKAEWFERTGDEALLSAWRRVKRALDPGWQLNPGVLLSAKGA